MSEVIKSPCTIQSPLLALQRSKKGQLHYDRNWPDEKSLENVLEDITKDKNVLELSILAKAGSVNNSMSPHQIGRTCVNTETLPMTRKKTPVNDKEQKTAGRKIIDMYRSSTNESPELGVGLSVESKLYQYEAQRKRSITISHEFRVIEFNKVMVCQRVSNKKNLQQKLQELEYKRTKEAVQMLEADTREEKIFIKKQSDILENRRKYSQSVSGKLNAVLVQQEQEEERKLIEENTNKLEVRKQQIDTMFRKQKLFTDTFQKIKDVVVEIPTEVINKELRQLRRLKDGMEKLVDKVKVGELNTLDLDVAQDILVKEEALFGAIYKVSDEIKKTAEETLIQQKMLEAVRTVNSPQGGNTHMAVVQSDKFNQRSEETSVIGDIEDEVNEEIYIYYTNIMQKLTDWNDSVQDFINDDNNRNLRFLCQKAVNTPLNAISDASIQHLKQKLVRLLALLSGQIKTGNHISAISHPAALNFCIDLLAKKFVKQGADVVSSYPDGAFSIAAVIVAIWAQNKDFGDLLLAHFYRTCPYLVPYYAPLKEGQTEEQFYKSRGYRLVDGTLESQDQFLKRMRGTVYLYAAILVSALPRDISYQPHPHAIHYGWSWLAAFLNIKPQCDITATVLYTFLEVAGHSLAESYGKQFHKLLHIICKEFFPKIQAVTSAKCGPVARLETFLHSCLKQGIVPSPKGALPHDYW